MTHVTSGEVVKEFLYELGATWAIFGTSEAGVGARGALALQKPVVLFVNNEAHERVLRDGLEAGIVESIVADGAFSSKNLAATWRAPARGRFSESMSGGQTSEASAEDQGMVGSSMKVKKQEKSKKAGKSDKKKKKKCRKKDKRCQEDSPAASGSTNVLQSLLRGSMGSKSKEIA